MQLVVKILWQSDEDKITFEETEKYIGIGLRKTSSKLTQVD